MDTLYFKQGSENAQLSNSERFFNLIKQMLSINNIGYIEGSSGSQTLYVAYKGIQDASLRIGVYVSYVF